MEEEFVNPNFHVAIVHFPLALLIFGTLIELFSFMWRRHGFRAAGRWMILLGALTSLPTAVSGLYALVDVASPAPGAMSWKEATAAGRLSEPQWDILEKHLSLMIGATALSLLVVIVWIACSDRWRGRLHLPLLALLLLSAGLCGAGAWHGGEAVYRHGVAVSGHEVGPTTQPAATRQGAREHHPLSAKAAYFLPPMQVHVISGGTVAALGLLALALSVRKITQGPPVTHVDHIAAALGPPPTLIGNDGPDSLMSDPEDFHAPTVPAARFWLLTALLAIMTAGGGYWTIAHQSDLWALPELWNTMIVRNVRLLGHAIGGGSIIVLSLILAMLARWAPRRKWALAIFAGLLLLAVGVQVWLGIAMLMDGPHGPATGFN